MSTVDGNDTGGASSRRAELLVAFDEAGNVVATHTAEVHGPTDVIASAVGLVARHGARVQKVELTPELAGLPVDRLHAALRDVLADLDLPKPGLPDVDLPPKPDLLGG